jgi:FMN phosphatase YigB (HAD superfamily)
VAEVRALLFDLGGVVLHVDFDRALAAWQRHSRLAPARLRAAFAFDEPYLRHETGALGAPAYFDHLRRNLALACDDDAVREGWNEVLVAEMTGTLQAIDAVRERIPCYALSNTNEAHLQHIRVRFPEVLARFRQVFVSHEIGYRKPHPRAFGHVLDAIGVAAADVLFFDDLQENVDAARRCGLQAQWVGTPADVRAALAERALL